MIDVGSYEQQPEADIGGLEHLVEELEQVLLDVRAALRVLRTIGAQEQGRDLLIAQLVAQDREMLRRVAEIAAGIEQLGPPPA